MKLYNYFRSGTSHRLRIALNLKGLDYEYVAVNLLQEEHFLDRFKKINPQGFVPVLDTDGAILTQSPAIIEWLEEKYPHPPLLPENHSERRYVRALAAIVGSDIHPLNNRRILQNLRNKFNASEDAVNEWCEQWITEGFDTIESIVGKDKNRRRFCFGSAPTIADIYLIPQIESARRFKVDLKKWPAILDIEEHCLALDSFRLASPSLQLDA
jgi:maleylpyruvate isomerase